MNFDISLVDVHGVSTVQNRVAPNWLLAAILYASYIIAEGAAMFTVMGVERIKMRKMRVEVELSAVLV